jgi:hypothetical protein
MASLLNRDCRQKHKAVAQWLSNRLCQRTPSQPYGAPIWSNGLAKKAAEVICQTCQLIGSRASADGQRLTTVAVALAPSERAWGWGGGEWQRVGLTSVLCAAVLSSAVPVTLGPARVLESVARAARIFSVWRLMRRRTLQPLEPLEWMVLAPEGLARN